LDLPQDVMQLVYRQGLIWFGMGFSPILPIIGMFGDLLNFGVYSLLVCFKVATDVF
jgi:hypothetical protein